MLIHKTLLYVTMICSINKFIFKYSIKTILYSNCDIIICFKLNLRVCHQNKDLRREAPRADAWGNLVISSHI
jgi:hypothetical protein